MRPGSLLMPLQRPRSLTAALLASVLPFLVVACHIHPCLISNPLEAAASYDWLTLERRYSEPLNTWVKNPGLEKFLLQKYASGGIEALKSIYGLDCGALSRCADCYVCQARIRKKTVSQEAVIREEACREVGHMMMVVEIGPGSESISAMTYWERSPVPPGVGR